MLKSFSFLPKHFWISWLSNLLTLNVHDDGYSRNVPDEGFSRNVPDEGFSPYECRNTDYWATHCLSYTCRIKINTKQFVYNKQNDLITVNDLQSIDRMSCTSKLP
jgi:hypothetical protein